MASAKVKVAFTDKENMTDVYYVGDVFEGSEERINELIASGHVEAAVDEKPKAEKPKAAPHRRKPAAAKE